MRNRKTKGGPDPFLHTLAFVAARWRRQPGRAALIAAGVLIGAGIELVLPMLAGRLVDIIGGEVTDRACSGCPPNGMPVRSPARRCARSAAACGRSTI